MENKIHTHTHTPELVDVIVEGEGGRDSGATLALQIGHVTKPRLQLLPLADSSVTLTHLGGVVGGKGEEI